MDSPISNLNRTGKGFNIYVVSPETKEIILYHILNSDTTFEGVINDLKRLGKPSQIFYYNGNTTQVKATDKVSPYLPFRQNQVLFWTTSNSLEFPVVQPRQNNILVLMITPEFKMLAFEVSASLDINYLRLGYRSLVKLIDGNQTKIAGGTIFENLPARSNQIIFLLGEKSSQTGQDGKSGIAGSYQRMIIAGRSGDLETVQLLGDRIINLLYAPNIVRAGPTAPIRTRTTLNDKVIGLILVFYRSPTIVRYLDVSRMTPDGRGTRMYFGRDSPSHLIHKVPRNKTVSKTFPIAYTTQDQYKAALKIMGLSTYYP